MTLPNLLKELFHNSSERIKNPLIGAFATSWIIFNWKAILITLFSNETIIKRIEIVTESYSPNSQLVTYPLLASFFYVLVLPYIMWGLDKLANRALLERKNNLHRVALHDLMNKQTIVKQEVVLEELKSDKKEKSELNHTILSLQEQLDESEVHIESLNQQLAKLRALAENDNQHSISTEEETLFQQEYESFTESDIYDFFEDVGTSVSSYRSFPQGTNPIVEQKFIHKGIITKDENDESHFYGFTKKGQFFWKTFVLSRSINRETSRHDVDDLPF